MRLRPGRQTGCSYLTLPGHSADQTGNLETLRMATATETYDSAALLSCQLTYPICLLTFLNSEFHFRQVLLKLSLFQPQFAFRLGLSTHLLLLLLVRHLLVLVNILKHLL
jgi:hypothetical protein